MRYTSLALALSLSVLSVLRAEAQQEDSAATRTAAGARSLACVASMGATTASSSVDTTPRTARAGATTRASIDTTITLAITDRTWQRDDYEGGIALSAGSPRTGRSQWRACAGAAVHLGHVATTLHNVHGVIHLRADLSALQRAGEASREAPSQGSGSTPPAAPPGR